MKNGFTFVSLCLLTVAGCSSGGGGEESGPETVAAAKVSVGIVPSMATVDYDEATNVLTVTDGVTTRALPAFVGYDTPGFAGFYLLVGGSSSNFGSGAETSSGGGRVATVSSPNDELGVSGTFMERTGDTEVPDTGTATYTGNYVSWFAVASDLRANRLVTGAATLNVDFADSSVDGMITDRQNRYSSETFADILLVEGSIVDGQFSGTTTGGESSIAGATAAGGEYVGLLTGANAEEAVGGVQLTHTISGLDLIETGAFVVE